MANAVASRTYPNYEQDAGENVNKSSLYIECNGDNDESSHKYEL